MIFAKLSGLSELASTLGNARKALKVASAARSADIAGRMVEEMQARAPEDSGTLRESIRKEANDDGTVTVRAGGTPETARPTKSGTVYDEALLTEHGTVHQAARPFFWPVVEEHRNELGPDVIRAGEDAGG